jgi:hypothetical protein
MENIESETIRLETPGCYQRRPVPCQGVVELPQPSDSPFLFSEVLKRRRSADTFLPLSEEGLSNFLHDVASLQKLNLLDGNRQRRYVASMGALHPAHLLLYRPRKGWFTYLPERHALGVLAVNRDSSTAVCDVVREHHPSGTSTVLCLLSDCELAGNYYEHYVSLLLKDAGILLWHASLVAAAHNLAFRILGRNGAKAANALVPSLPFKSLASGLALLGQAEHLESSIDDRSTAVPLDAV